MTPFYQVRTRAISQKLDGQGDARVEYYASDEFCRRIEFKGEQGRHDEIAITLYLLERIALDPRIVTLSGSNLDALSERGVPLFGIANPIPCPRVERGSAEQAAIRAAIERNLQGPLYAAAQRVARVRAKSARRSAYEDRILDKFRASLPWPEAGAWRQNQERAQQEQHALNAMVNEKRRVLRERHQRRMAAMADAAAPGVHSYHELLQDIADNFLQPS